MKIENHTVTIPADDYIKYRDFYENRELYDTVLTVLLNNLSSQHAREEGFAVAKKELAKSGIEFSLGRENYNNKFFFNHIKKS